MVVILVILWLLGFFGRNINASLPRTGNWIHTLIVIAVSLIVLHFVGLCKPFAPLRLARVCGSLRGDPELSGKVKVTV